MSTTMAVIARRPGNRWRWLAAYWLIKLAARIYQFDLEFYRTEEPQDRMSNR
jgi:hypothetical protein